MTSRPFESPPPYRPDELPSHYARSNVTYAEDMYPQPMYSQPAYSYYPEDEVQHFYRWTSPPGIIKIMSILIIVMCIGIFACVASTLAWDLQYSGSSSSGYGTGYPSYGGFGGGYGYGSGYGGAYGIAGNYIDPRAAKSFILVMAAICFIAGLAAFIASVTNSSMCRTRRYYLTVIIVSAILAALVFIASIVYVMAVNPTAQASGTVFYAQLTGLCGQYYASTNTGILMNQYLYHYCVVEPQEAIAIVLGFLVVVAFAIIIYFAVKTRYQMNNYGKMNILWNKEQVCEEDPPNVEEWVKNVNAEPVEVPPVEVVDCSDHAGSSVAYYASEKVKENQIYTDTTYRTMPESDITGPSVKDLTRVNYTGNSYDGSAKEPPQKRRPQRQKGINSDNYDADYATGGESCDELEEDWDREYPPLTSDHQRQAYKRDFDFGLQEYKSLQAELDEVSKALSRLDKELDDFSEDSEEYKVAAEQYNRMKEIKASADYKDKKARCKKLKSKLSHIKRMVNDYDNRKPYSGEMRITT
ncbi:occludin isoform X2 [Carettochelys insculpta]|uniref:occludin isoform X2 n=1 Tax=Carettochelys insculpta TaxID=44489 RepID=UPI003EC13B2B